jgi:hypothetical protein
MTYQRLLRALGACLDGEPPGRFKVIEVLDGLILILERGPGEPQLQQVHFDRTMLACRSPGLPARPGYELDASEARSICLDELADGLLVTYSYLDPKQGYSWRKTSAMLRAPDMQTILQTAKQRKQQGFLHARRH